MSLPITLASAAILCSRSFTSITPLCCRYAFIINPSFCFCKPLSRHFSLFYVLYKQ